MGNVENQGETPIPTGTLMKGKRGLIMGVANDKSIAWGITQYLAAQGAEIAFTYQGEALERRVRPLAESVGGKLILPCDVTNMQSIDDVFAIAAASYFPLLFMSVWWRGMTMKGAATGMLAGGVCALSAVVLTNLSDLKKVDLTSFWVEHPLARILCEQPAIWCVPLAITLMVVISKLTIATVVGLAVFVFFVLLGLITVNAEVARAWTQAPPPRPLGA